ncbi:hypothetical protein SEVIR_5G389950v4 [Setaria viridis]
MSAQGSSRTPTPVPLDLLPLPVGAAAQRNANSNSITLLAEREMAGRGTEAAQEKKQGRPRPGDVRDEATPVEPHGQGRAADGGGAPPSPPRASRRNAGGAAFNGFRGGGKHDLL